MFDLMIVWFNWSPRICKILIYIFEPLFSGVIGDLKLLKVKPETYFLNLLINSLIYSILLFGLIFGVYSFIGLAIEPIFIVFVFLVIFIFFLFYPKVLISQFKERIDRELFYALRDLTVQVSAGVSLYTAIKNIAKSDYGLVSDEFKLVIADIEAGISLDSALKKMMGRTYSDHLKRVLWQAIVVIKSGSPVVNVLEDILVSLKDSQDRKVSQYLYEINLWVIIFLIVSITIPAIIYVLSSVFSSMIAINPFASVLFIIMLSSIFQLLIIWYVKIRRPNVIE